MEAEAIGGIIGALVGLGVAIAMIAGMWKTFAKAGKPGWACIVPIYNIIVMLQIAGLPLWMIVGMFIPFINGLLYIWIFFNLAKRFGGGIGLTLLLLLSIGWLVIGFGSAEYSAPEEAAA